jgi:hypothetical protein
MGLLNPKGKVDNLKETINTTKKYNSTDNKMPTKIIISTVGKGCFLLMLVLYIFIGLFTYNWVAFLIYIMITVGIIAPIQKMFNAINSVFFTWLSSLLGFILGIFVIINQFHLRIDLFEYFRTLLNV